MDRREPADYVQLFIGALFALIGEAILSFGFFFAPGWANGWPGGLTIYQVWSTWLTLVLFAMLMTFGLGVVSLACILLCLVPTGQRCAGMALAIGMAIWAVISAVICSHAFSVIYASTFEMWPNGYPG